MVMVPGNKKGPRLRRRGPLDGFRDRGISVRTSLRRMADVATLGGRINDRIADLDVAAIWIHLQQVPHVPLLSDRVGTRSSCTAHTGSASSLPPERNRV